MPQPFFVCIVVCSYALDNKNHDIFTLGYVLFWTSFYALTCVAKSCGVSFASRVFVVLSSSVKLRRSDDVSKTFVRPWGGVALKSTMCLSELCCYGIVPLEDDSSTGCAFLESPASVMHNCWRSCCWSCSCCLHCVLGSRLPVWW